MSYLYTLTKHYRNGWTVVLGSELTEAELPGALARQHVLGPAVATDAAARARRAEAPVKLPGHMSYLTIEAELCPHDPPDGDVTCGRCGAYIGAAAELT